MIKKKNISFYLVIFLFFFTFVNLLSFIAIKIITKKNIYSKDYVEFKKRFRKSDSKSTYPHPFFGFGVKQNFSSTDLLNDEPIFVNDLNFIDSNNKIKVLILGGSVAKHLSLNNSSDTIKFKKNILNNEEIFENSLNKFFNTEKFKVYNAAIYG